MFIFTFHLRYSARDRGFQTKVIASCSRTAQEKMQHLHPNTAVTLVDVMEYQPPRVRTSCTRT